mmetsp:Transcript_8732/g.14849  ORF Transcript_8732/g.14849 Transcript_8732/m.14849 type:complete len:92 (-) Transcript_8732:175-450(-)
MNIIQIFWSFLIISFFCYSSQALSREAIEKKLQDASDPLRPRGDSAAKNAINVKDKMASNRNAQKLKQDIRNAKRQNKKDVRKAKKNRGEL